MKQGQRANGNERKQPGEVSLNASAAVASAGKENKRKIERGKSKSEKRAHSAGVEQRK